MWLYNILIRLYAAGIWVYSFFSPKANKLIKAYATWEVELIKAIDSNHEYIWFHASSLGEFEDGRCVLEELRRAYPQYKYVLTFFSSTGYEAKKNSKEADIISYLPLDTRKNARRFLDIIKPRLAIFSRNDIWPNYLHQLKQSGIPAVLISFQFSQQSQFFKKPFMWFYSKRFNSFDTIFTQNANTANALSKLLNCQNVVVAGNPRVDRIYSRYLEKSDYPEINRFVNKERCVVAGSLAAGDTEFIFDNFSQLESFSIKWIIVPHEINSREYESAKTVFGDKMILYSDIINQQANQNVLWVDCVGILPDLYQFACAAFIGGGYSKQGIHNIIEPAVYGCAIGFGPNYRGYSEAIYLLNTGGASVISTPEEFKRWLKEAIKDGGSRERIAASNKQYVIDEKGATAIIIQELERNYFN